MKIVIASLGHGRTRATALPAFKHGDIATIGAS
jgi:hypothetical protein